MDQPLWKTRVQTSWRHIPNGNKRAAGPRGAKAFGKKVKKKIEQQMRDIIEAHSGFRERRSG